VLTGAGVGPGDRVAVMLHNRPELFAVWNGVARVGALVVPVSYRSLTSEVAYLVDDSGATALFYDDAEVVEPALPERSGLRAAWHADDDALWSSPGTPPTDEYLGASVVTMNYTSGTTGRPKGIERVAPQPATEYAPNALAAFWGFTATDVHLLCGPAYHTAPGNYAQMSLGEGGSVVIMPRFVAESCLELIERERVTTSHMVPANFIRILEARWQDYDRSSIKKILHAAAPCPPAVKRQIMEVFPPGTVWEYYGASEGMGTVISPEEWLRKPGSVGRAFPGLRITIRDDDGNELPLGEAGEICAKGPQVMAGYWNRPDETAKVMTADGYFRTGDIGVMSPDGYTKIVDRKKDMILVSGFNVYPNEIEEVIASHPGVLECAVIGVADSRSGEAVKAFIVKKDPNLTPEDVIKFCTTQLTAYKIPKQIEFRTALPKTNVGKILRRELRDEKKAAAA
jgi:acyl-CoA synthetase (AMP-forming)/AMP-acid ligase II